MAVSGTRGHRGEGGGVETRGGRSRGLQCSMGDTSREIGRGRGWRLPPLRRSGGGEKPPKWPEPGAAVQQSTVRERRSVWWGPQHPSVGGG